MRNLKLLLENDAFNVGQRVRKTLQIEAEATHGEVEVVLGLEPAAVLVDFQRMPVDSKCVFALSHRNNKF